MHTGILRTVLTMCLVTSSFLQAGEQTKIIKAVEKVPDQYIVIVSASFGPVDDARAQAFVANFGGTVRSVYSNIFKGFSLTIPSAAAELLAKDPNVEHMEEVAVGHASVASASVQTGYPSDPRWHLQRLEQRVPVALNGTTHPYNPLQTGKGVYAYIIDTGVWGAHYEFSNKVEVDPIEPIAIVGALMPSPFSGPPVPSYQSRMLTGRNFTAEPCGTIFMENGQAVRGGDDPTCGGTQLAEYTAHGTAVASALGGQTLGVATEVNIVPLQTLRYDQRTTSAIFEDAIEWLLAKNQYGAYVNLKFPAVANYSGLFEYKPCQRDPDYGVDTTTEMTTVDLAVTAVINAGVTFVTSANNQKDAPIVSADCPRARTPLSRACEQTPARLARAITVGGIGPADEVSVFDGYAFNGDVTVGEHGSNTGPCVDIYAPGEDLRLADLSTDNSFNRNCKENLPNCTTLLKPSSDVNAIMQKGRASGTSYAAPQVAGAAALYLETHKEATPATVWDFIRANATLNAVKSGSAVIAYHPHILFSRFAPMSGVLVPLNRSSATLFGSDFVPDTYSGGVKIATGTRVYVNNAEVATTSKSETMITFPLSGLTAGEGYGIGVVNPDDAAAGRAGGSTGYFTGNLLRAIHTGFNDSSASPFANAIETLARHRVVVGVGGGNFNPTGYVTRGEMAVFLLGSSHGAGYTPEPCVGAARVFSDVFSTNGYCPWVEQLWREGISVGCASDSYCPDNNITKEQIAVFTLLGKNSSVYRPDVPAAVTHYSDVTNPQGPRLFNHWIHDLAKHSIDKNGCSNPSTTSSPPFCPSDFLTRGEMAQYMTEAFNLQCQQTEACR